MKELRRKHPYFIDEDEYEERTPTKTEQQQKWIIFRWTRQEDVKEILIPADVNFLKALADFLMVLSGTKR